MLECAVYHVVTANAGRFSGPLEEAFPVLVQDLHAWDTGRRGNLLPWGQPSVADPALPALNVAARWTSSAADRFRDKVRVALRYLETIQRSRWDETEVQHWGELFGAPFPAPSTVARGVRQEG